MADIIDWLLMHHQCEKYGFLGALLAMTAVSIGFVGWGAWFFSPNKLSAHLMAPRVLLLKRILLAKSSCNTLMDNRNREERLVVLNEMASSVIEKVRGQHPDYVFTYNGKPVARMLRTHGRKHASRLI